MWDRFFLCFSFLLVLNSCTTVPVANSTWMFANCLSLGYTVYDTKSYSNCTLSNEGVYSCNMSDGTYKGKLKEGIRHGVGTFTWQSGRTYKGEWKDGERWCGVEQRDNDFWTYKNGKASYGKAGVDWRAAVAGLVVAGEGYSVADAPESGSNGYSPSNNTSPMDCSYNLNYTTYTVENSN